MTPLTLPPQEAATFLGIGRDRVIGLFDTGVLKGHMNGNRRRFSVESLKAYNRQLVAARATELQRLGVCEPQKSPQTLIDEICAAEMHRKTSQT